MAGEAEIGVEYRPLVLDPNDAEDARLLAELRAETYIEFVDLRGLLAAEFDRLTDPPDLSEGPEGDRWVYYPWRRSVVGLPGERLFRAIRLDRNRNKITRAEQARLSGLTIGVIGQSVGHAVAYAIAQEGLCGSLRLADFDELELSNLNRVPATLFDITVNKAIVTARRIAELDPYLTVEVRGGGVDEQTADEFVDGLSIVVEECDSLDVKLLVREAAARKRIPLVMETSDRGLLDVERFDLEPDRSPFHGLLDDTKATQLRGLSARDKAPYVVALLGPREVSARMAASMVEVGETLSSWPQLAGDIMLGAAGVAAVIRRIGLGRDLRSGRARVDVDQALDALAEPGDSALTEDSWDDPERLETAADPIGRVLECAQRAPSGGNVQPWSLRPADDAIEIALDPRRSTAMDIGYRGSAVAVGAALYNARAAAAAHGLLGPYELREATDTAAPLTAVLRLGTDTDEMLAADYRQALHRETNRHLGRGGVIPDPVLAELDAAATAEGATMRAMADPEGIAAVAAVVAESDRVRYLTPRLHREMFDEIRRPGDDPETGIDIRSLELAPDERAAMEIGRRADVMALLHDWSAGTALGDYSRDRLASSSAVVAVTFTDAPETGELTGYVRAGAAVQRLWIHAQRRGLAVQPVSPVFLFARHRHELDTISPRYADRLFSLQERLLDLLGVPEQDSMALLLRLSYAAAAGVRSRRRPVSDADTRS